MLGLLQKTRRRRTCLVGLHPPAPDNPAGHPTRRGIGSRPASRRARASPTSPGTSGADQGLSAAYNDVGIFTLKDRRSYAIAAFLTGSTAPDADRATLFADLGRLAVRSVG